MSTHVPSASAPKILLDGEAVSRTLSWIHVAGRPKAGSFDGFPGNLAVTCPPSMARN